MAGNSLDLIRFVWSKENLSSQDSDASSLSKKIAGRSLGVVLMVLDSLSFGVIYLRRWLEAPLSRTNLDCPKGLRAPRFWSM